MPDYKSILKQYWGYDAFRGVQEDIIRSIGSGKDTLGLMPTGGGKSITFQVPALSQKGLCLVITPLIALMKDQVQNLRARGIKATAVYAGMTHEEILTALDNCIFGDYKFLYISPERLDTELFRNKLRSMCVSMITVDESHCISQWGYDFRPAYLKIAEIRELLPGVPVLALTATATPEVVKDIQTRLLFPKENVFRMSFERKNLAYIVRRTEDKLHETLHILNRVTGSAIIYTRNRKKTKEIAQYLCKENITATFYHAGLNNEVKDQRQKSWQTGDIRVMVATNAFGMGIDKPDVRMVIHIDFPDSPEAYFQEAGRAGRDGHKAYAVLLYARSDKTILNKRIADTFPDKECIRKIYEHICYYYQMPMGEGEGNRFAFNIDDFSVKFKHFPIQVDSALQILTRAGYLEYANEQDNNSRLIFTLGREELYRINEQSSEAETLIRVILRSYTGLFSDYAYISEETLAIKSGLTNQQVYDILVSLTRKGIIHYIPGRKTPTICFTCRRQETTRIVIGREIYEDRKVSYEQRIHAMLDYAESETHCRSRMLLKYFGEKNEHNCGQCDVCLQKHDSGLNTHTFEEIKNRIMELLRKEGGCTSHKIVESFPQAERNAVLKVVSFLLSEEIINQRDGKLLTSQ